MTSGPESTAVRVALWRALHVELDPPPHVFVDKVGLQLAAPEEAWRLRPDMHPEATKPLRASIVARARFIEDTVTEAAGHGVGQYVILGAGLDTFVQRKPEMGVRLHVFEVDQPEPQSWKHQRLIDLGFGVPEWLHWVPVDFQLEPMWEKQLTKTGFDKNKPAVIASAGVSMYLPKEVTRDTLRQIAAFASGSTLIMTFLLPIDLAEPEAQPGIERSIKGAQASGTPFISFFTPEEISAMAHEAGFHSVQHVSAAMLNERYFANRTDGLRQPLRAQELIVART